MAKSLLANGLKAFKKLHVVLKIVIFLGLFFLVRIGLDALLWGGHENEQNVEGFQDPQGKSVILFHWKDCGHCKKMMPEWERFKKLNAHNKKYKIIALEKDEAPELIQKHNVQGFPTIIGTNEKGEKVKDFEGERKAEDLQRFGNSL